MCAAAGPNKPGARPSPPPASGRPPFPPRSPPGWPLRSMTAQEKTLQSRVVARAMQACRVIDSAARAVSMTEDAEGLTHMRVRAGDAHTLNGLRSALQRMLPLSTTQVTESLIDGTLEASVTVPTEAQERLAARCAVAKERLATYWLLAAWACFFVGVGEWWWSVNAGVEAKDEL